MAPGRQPAEEGARDDHPERGLDADARDERDRPDLRALDEQGDPREDDREPRETDNRPQGHVDRLPFDHEQAVDERAHDREHHHEGEDEGAALGRRRNLRTGPEQGSEEPSAEWGKADREHEDGGRARDVEAEEEQAVHRDAVANEGHGHELARPDRAPDRRVEVERDGVRGEDRLGVGHAGEEGGDDRVRDHHELRHEHEGEEEPEGVPERGGAAPEGSPRRGGSRRSGRVRGRSGRCGGPPATRLGGRAAGGARMAGRHVSAVFAAREPASVPERRQWPRTCRGVAQHPASSGYRLAKSRSIRSRSAATQDSYSGPCHARWRPAAYSSPLR